MIAGKISETQFKRSVLKQISFKNPDVLEGAGLASDCAVIKSDGDYSVAAASLMEIRNVKECAISAARALNAFATKGTSAKAALINVMLPTDFEEKDIKLITKEYNDYLKKQKVEIANINYCYSENIKSHPVSNLSVMGCVNKDDSKVFGGLKDIKAGQKIVMTKVAALESGYAIYLNKSESLFKKYQKVYVNAIGKYGEKLSALPEAAVATRHGVAAMHDLSEGGVFAGLWELASASGCGVKAYLDRIPVAQNIIEICELFDLNPYELPSTGSMLIICDEEESLLEELANAEISAACIGEITSDNDKVLETSDGTKRFLEKPKSGKLEKIYD